MGALPLYLNITELSSAEMDALPELHPELHTELRVELHASRLAGEGVKLALSKAGKEIARVRLFFIENELHDQPYALIEDLFVQEEFRGQSLGSRLMRAAIEEAKKNGCYKILATSRNEREKVHEFYRQLGFKEWGKEFRLELSAGVERVKM